MAFAASIYASTLILLLGFFAVALLFVLTFDGCFDCRATGSDGAAAEKPENDLLTLEMVRESLIRQEDSIVFALIERARFPYNAPTYDPSLFPPLGGRSIVEDYVRSIEALESKMGRYENQEEIPFFPEDLPLPLAIPYKYPRVFSPATASVTAAESIWNMYFKDLLPLLTSKGDDGNYAATAQADLACLQVLSKRIHYGKFVAKVKYEEARQNYIPAIQAKDRDALMELLTYKAVEDMVKKRVERKARVFGQNLTLEGYNDEGNCKIDPTLAYRLYEEWIIPITKYVEVEYLLRCLD